MSNIHNITINKLNRIKMKLVDISSSCYAHLIDNVIYLYIDNEFAEMFYIDNIEYLEDPIPLIFNEIELSSRPSLYKNLECNF